jgi:hypothetical protein
MRRLALCIPIIAVLAGCESAGPLDPSTAASGASMSATDEGILIGSGTSSTGDEPLPDQSPAPAETAAGGIMMGSGT